jgi:CubicO group peptidase (beta-lactamase class C family)
VASKRSSFEDSIPNPDLVVRPTGLVDWNLPEHRRQSLSTLRDLVRYGMTVRAPRVRLLAKDVDHRIGGIDRVARLTTGEPFRAMVVVRDGGIVYEKYAPDFSPDRLHSIMSISKTTMALAVGRQVAEGRIDPSATVPNYVPEIGSGYADATVQQVLDMDVVNAYTEDFGDPTSTVWQHEAVVGWRVLPDDEEPSTLREFLLTIEAANVHAPHEVNYKDANTDLLGWIVERVAGRSLSERLVEIFEAAGIERSAFLACDRAFTPLVSFGISLTARDLARYGMLLLDGVGVDGRRVGDPSFIHAAKSNTGTPFRLNRAVPSDWHYSNQLLTNGRWVGHPGYAGQWLAVDHDTRTVLAYFSVLESYSGMEDAYHADVYALIDDVLETLEDARRSRDA